MSSKSSSVSWVTRRVMPRPALLTQTSIWPKRSRARSRSRSTSPRRVTSVTTARAVSPSRFATADSSSARRAATTMPRAPRAATTWASCSPMPDDAPVMTMTVSCMREWEAEIAPAKAMVASREWWLNGGLGASNPPKYWELEIARALPAVERMCSGRLGEMRVACLDLPAFPLQLVWRQELAWRTQPVVVIENDRPQGEVLWACERARAMGVLVGQRYAYALSLCGGLRARVVPREQIDEAITELRAALHRLSPGVEPGEPGTFWLDGEGLGQVFPDGGKPRGRAWGDAIAQVLAELEYRGAVVVGFSRFATYAIARAMRLGVASFASD